MKRRQLLPAVEGQKPDHEDPQSASASSGQATSQKRSRISTRIACERCRTKKKACDGNKPSCESCAAQGFVCSYPPPDSAQVLREALTREKEEWKARAEELEQFVGRLIHMPESSAHRTLQELRTSDTPKAVVRAVVGGPSGTRPSDQASALSFLPSIYSSMELELMVRYPVAYPLLKPPRSFLDGQQLAAGLSISSSSYKDTPPSSLPDGQGLPQLSRRAEFGTVAEDASTLSPTEAERRGSTPKPTPHPPLERLDIRTWTSVPISNDVAASAISSYLETDHHFIGVFDADLFLHGLVNCEPEACSPFLLNSLLAFACQGYAAVEYDCLHKSHEFEHEAEKLWRSEESSDSVCNIAGLVLLFWAMATHGHAEKAKKYLKALCEMVMRMKVFGADDAVSADDIASLPPEQQLSLARAAWGAFGFVCIQTLFYQWTADNLKYPPKLPIPGAPQRETGPRDAQEEGQESAEDSSGLIFSSFCSLLVIASEILLMYQREEGPQGVVISSALSKYDQLLSLSERLAGSIARGASDTAPLLTLHIWYHAVVLDLFRPFIIGKRRTPGPPSSFSQQQQRLASATSSAEEAIFTASLNQLKSLVVTYTTKHPGLSRGVSWHLGLLYVANAALMDPSDPQWHFYFSLCVRSYVAIFRRFQFSDNVVRGLLFMAVEKGALALADAQDLSRQLLLLSSPPKPTPTPTPTATATTRQEEQQQQQSTAAAARPARHGFIMDQGLAITAPEEARVDRLADKFADMEMFETFTENVL